MRRLFLSTLTLAAAAAWPACVGAPTIPGGFDAAARTTAAVALGGRANVQAFRSATCNDDCALDAAFASLLSTGGTVWVPAGQYTWATAHVWRDKSVHLRFEGRGVVGITIVQPGVGLSVLQTGANSIFNRTIIDGGATFYAGYAGGQVQAAIHVEYATVASFPQSTTTIGDFDFLSTGRNGANAAPYPNTFKHDIELVNNWSPKLSNLHSFKPMAPGTSSGATMVDVCGGADIQIDEPVQYYGDALVNQSCYAEGIHIHHKVIVGTNYEFTQGAFSPNPSDGFKLLGFWDDGGEANTYLGVVNATFVQTGMITGGHASRYGDSGAAGWAWMNLADSQGFVAVGNKVIGGGTNKATNTGVRLRQTTGNSSRNMFADNGFENIGTPSDLDAASAPYNMLSWVPEYGQTGVGQNVISWVGRQGQTLATIDNLDNAANFVRQRPGASGNPATLAFDGSDGSVGGTIQTKGGSLYGTTNGDNQGGNLFTFNAAQGGAGVNYPAFTAASHGNAVTITAASSDGETPNMAIGPGAGAYTFLMNIPSCSASGLPSGALCSKGNTYQKAP